MSRSQFDEPVKIELYSRLSPSITPCLRCSQVLCDGTIVNAQSNSGAAGELSSCTHQNILFMPATRLLSRTRILTKITKKMRIAFVGSSIIYLLLGGLSVGVETGIIMYSSSTYYRGICIGILLLITGIDFLIISSQVTSSFIYVIRLLTTVLAFCSVGLVICIIDFEMPQLCTRISVTNYSCESDIGRQLKLVLLIEFIVAIIYTSAGLAITSITHKRSRTR